MSDEPASREQPAGRDAPARRGTPVRAAAAGPPCPDFLPPAWHAGRARRRVTTWRTAAALAAAGLLIAGGLGGLWRTRRLQAERDAVVTRAEALATLDARAAALRGAAADADERAAVLAGLHLRTPPSRLLCDLAAALPAGVTLTELTLAPLTAPADRDANPEPAGETTAVAADAAALARRRRTERLELRLRGSSPTDAAVARFLTDAAAAGSFDSVELLFSDRAGDAARPARGFAGPRAAPDAAASGSAGPEGGARVFSARLTARPAAATE